MKNNILSIKIVISLLFVSTVFFSQVFTAFADSYTYTYTLNGQTKTEPYPTETACDQRRVDMIQQNGISGTCALLVSNAPVTGFYCYDSNTGPSTRQDVKTTCFPATQQNICESTRSSDKQNLSAGCSFSSSDKSGTKVINLPQNNPPTNPSGNSAYVPLAPINVNGVGQAPTANLSVFLIYVFRIFVAGSAALAVLMIILGGVQYMSTDAFSGKSDGRKRINDALIGLLLVMVAYLVLRTINPDIVNFSIINKDLGTTTSNSNFSEASNAKVIPLTGHSGETGTASTQSYSFKTVDGKYHTVTGMKAEDLNNLADTDFYSFTLIRNSQTLYYTTMSECLSNQSTRRSGDIVTACTTMTGPSTYSVVDGNGKVLKSNETLSVCQSDIKPYYLVHDGNGTTLNQYPGSYDIGNCQSYLNSSSNIYHNWTCSSDQNPVNNWTCVAVTPTFGYSFGGLNNTIFNNLTLQACTYERTSLPQTGQTASPCVKTPLN